MKRISVLMMASLFLMQPGMAADIAKDIRTGDDAPDTSDGGFLEIGLIGIANDSPRINDESEGRNGAGLVIAFEYRFKGLFVEAINGSSDGLNLGYKLWNNQHWMVDLIAVNVTPGGTNPIDSNLTEQQRDNWLMDRQTALTGAGVRLTGYVGEYILQFRLLNDAYNNRGNYATARLGRSWQYRNWNFHGIVSANYLSSRFSQYTVGISPEEATTRFPEYVPGASVFWQAEAGVTYPINEHWVFRSTLKYGLVSSAAEKSPLFDGNSGTTFLTSISYVF